MALTRSVHDLRLLAAASLAWAVVAVGLATRMAPRDWLLISAAALLLGIALMPVGHRLARVVALAALLTAVVCGTTSVHEKAATRGPLSELAKSRATVSVTMKVTGSPKKLKPLPGGHSHGGDRYLLTATVTHIDGRGQRADVQTPIVVIGNSSWASARWRSQVSASGRLSQTQQLGEARGMLLASAAPKETKSPQRIFVWAEQMRATFRRATSPLPRDAAGLVPALVDGDVAGMPQDLSDTMNDVGMSHLNAVSGSNVTIILMATLWCAAGVGVRWRARLPVALSALAAYVVLCHPEPSVIRAAAMGAVGVLGTSCGRPRAAAPALGAAIFGLLLWQPWLAINAGFALSALATLGLILFASSWQSSVCERHPRLPEKLVELTMVPLAAQALCLPILVALSGKISLISVPANMVAEPFVSPATLAGMATMLVGVVCMPVAQVLAWLPGVPGWIIAETARFSSLIPYGALPMPGGLFGPCLALVIVAVALFVRFSPPWSPSVVLGAQHDSLLVGQPGALETRSLNSKVFNTVFDASRRRGVSGCAAETKAAGTSGQGRHFDGKRQSRQRPARRRRGTGFAVVCVLTAVVAIALYATWPRPAIPPVTQWRYAQCDVGQGDGGIVRTSSNAAVAVDVGPPDTNGMITCLHRYHVTKLDAIVLTHYHLDHVGALDQVLKAVPVGEVIVNPVMEGARDDGQGEKGAGDLVMRVLDAHHIKPVTMSKGGVVTFSNVTFRAVWPGWVIHAGSVQNNASICLDISAPDLHLLMLGDAEKEAQQAIEDDVRASAKQRPFDVVKMAHHGSSNQDPDLYQIAAAPVVAIGVGKHNDYGHPTRKALEILANAHSLPVRSDLCGPTAFDDPAGRVQVSPAHCSLNAPSGP